jgi:hypothetical protein
VNALQLSLLLEPATPAPQPVVDAIDAELQAERDRLAEAWRRGRDRIEVDPKRLDKGGDIDRSYSAQSICEEGRVRSTFRLDGADWVNTGGLWWAGGRYCDCYRVIPLASFDGPTAPYAEWNWDRMRDSEMGGYHGMSVKNGKEACVLVGPAIVVVAGRPVQSTLL